MCLPRLLLASLWAFGLLLSFATNALCFSAASSPSSSSSYHFDTKIQVASSKNIQVPKVVVIAANQNDAVAAAEGGGGGKETKVNLATYMTLPVEQYVLVPMPLNAQLSRTIIHNEFLLTVPPLQFFSLTVQPLVTAQVQLTPSQVEITSTKCRLVSPPKQQQQGQDASSSLSSSSSYLERVHINDRFQFCATTTLTWKDNNDDDDNCILAHSNIAVHVDPPPPFDKLPRRLVQSTGRAVLRVAINYVLTSFLQGLVQDYVTWAQDANYRAQRQELSWQKNNQQEQQHDAKL